MDQISITLKKASTSRLQAIFPQVMGYAPVDGYHDRQTMIIVMSAKMRGITDWDMVTPMLDALTAQKQEERNEQVRALTDSQVIEIIARNEDGEGYVTLSREYGISAMSVKNVVKRKTYRHVVISWHKGE